jgi:hypothetical protein
VSPAGDAYLSWTMHPLAGGFSTLPAAPAFGDYDVTLVRFDTQGTAQWQRRYGSSGLDFTGRIALDGNGHLLAPMSFSAAAGPATVGTQTLTGPGESHSALLQLDALTGSINWVRTFTSDLRAQFSAVTTDAAGNAYVGGLLNGTTSLGGSALSSAAGSDDALVAAYSPQGTLRWVQKSDGSDADSINLISLSGNGELSVAGFFQNSARFGATTLATGAPNVVNGFVARFNALPTGTRAAHPRALGLYPNPAADQVRLPALAVGTPVQVLDALGRLVRETAVGAGAQVSVRGLAPGLYTLRATTATGEQFAGKLVVE